jgi:hypothetical protein
MEVLGQYPDTPGTELAAYLDRFSIEELMELIDYLRSPYRDAHSFYIYHAQQAIGRKKDYFRWWQDQYGAIAVSQPLFDQPHAELSLRENDDKNALVYSFRFNEIWQEVKASHPAVGSFQSDLFREENLWDKFRRTDDVMNRTEGLELEAESPFADLEALRQSESQGLDRYFSTEKYVLDTIEDEDPNCAELAAAIARLKELQGTDPAEIERLLGLETTPGGKSILDHVLWAYDKYKTGKIGLDLFNLSFMRDGIAVKLLEKIPVFAPTAWGVPSIAGVLLRIAPAITIPLTMWMKFLEAQSAGLAAEEGRGKLTAIRQWLRALDDWTFSPDFPDNLNIQLQPSDAVRHYFAARRADYGDYFEWIFDAESLRKGFEEGLRLMDQAGPAIVAAANEAVAATLREFDPDACRVKVLTDAGIIDLKRLKHDVIRAIVDTLLNQIPKVG